MSIDWSLVSWAIPAVGGLVVAGWWARRKARGWLARIRLDVGDSIQRPTAEGSYDPGRIVRLRGNDMSVLMDILSPDGRVRVMHVTLTDWAKGSDGQVLLYNLGRQDHRQELHSLGITGAEIGKLDSRVRERAAKT